MKFMIDFYHKDLCFKIFINENEKMNVLSNQKKLIFLIKQTEICAVFIMFQTATDAIDELKNDHQNLNLMS